MIQHRFGCAEPGTLGVEEELFFVDASTLDAAAGFSRVVGEGDERVKAEVFESLVELATPVVPDAGAALAELRRMRAEIAERAVAHGLRVYAAGAHPLASGEDQEIVPLPRYEQMASTLGDALRRQLVCGLHVHVSIPDADAALRAFESVVPWLPVLLALSANSPLVDCGDAGRRSERAERLLLLPTGGTPPVLRNWDDWRAATGSDSTRRHWDAWPRPGARRVESLPVGGPPGVPGAVRRRRPSGRHRQQPLRALRPPARVTAVGERRVGRERQQEREPRDHRLEGAQGRVRVGNGDVDVQPADQLPAETSPRDAAICSYLGSGTISWLLPEARGCAPAA